MTDPTLDLPPALARRLGPFSAHDTVADDGVRLAWQSFGRGPAILFANGIGVRYGGAAAQIEAFRDRHRILCWDYRGLGGSALLDPDRADVSMGRHAADGLAVLDAAGEDRAVVIGWSMGVGVGLEMIRRAPDRIAGFVALLGAPGRPFRTGLPEPAGSAAEAAFALARRFPLLAQAPLELAVALPGVARKLLSAISFLEPGADPTIFESNVRGVRDADKRAYLRTMLALAAHDATDLLPRVRCPTLVVAGTRDWLTPPRLARRMADAIPGAVYREIPGGSHFGLIEKAPSVNGWIGELLATAAREG